MSDARKIKELKYFSFKDMIARICVNCPDLKKCREYDSGTCRFSSVLDDVLDAMKVNREVRVKEAVELDFAESQIVDALHDNELHFEELLEITGLNVAELTNTLINLELNGIVQQTTGNYYILA